ncbi:MAG: hypothetical protein D6694_05845 [Gammaproteobacteria bacterium]|nr:MAG: hypothetical protein D6694_05845 [Gammaproteobacteria bacterium]
MKTEEILSATVREPKTVVLEQPRKVVCPISFEEVHTSSSDMEKRTMVSFTSKGLKVFKQPFHQPWYAVSIRDIDMVGVERIVVPVKKATISGINNITGAIENTYLIGVAASNTPLLLYRTPSIFAEELIGVDIQEAYKWLSIGITRSDSWMRHIVV